MSGFVTEHRNRISKSTIALMPSKEFRQKYIDLADSILSIEDGLEIYSPDFVHVSLSYMGPRTPTLLELAAFIIRAKINRLVGIELAVPRIGVFMDHHDRTPIGLCLKVDPNEQLREFCKEVLPRFRRDLLCGMGLNKLHASLAMAKTAQAREGLSKKLPEIERIDLKDLRFKAEEVIVCGRYVNDPKIKPPSVIHSIPIPATVVA